MDIKARIEEVINPKGLHVAKMRKAYGHQDR